MKILTARIASTVLYWLGHFVSVLFREFDRLSFLYPVYSRLICWSCAIEDWAGIEYNWCPPQPGEPEE